MKAKVLLIEDSPTQAGDMSKKLNGLGYEVVWADGGVSGLKMATTERPDIILLDIIMPDMDGYSVCRWLKLNEATQDIPVIMITVKGEINDKVGGLETGATDYLPKPFDERELEARIYAALRTKAIHKQLLKKNKELEHALQNVEHLAITDPLTGLYNRRRFYDCLKKDFASTKRYAHALSCIIIDVDHFKKINDRYGHLVGDAVLKDLAQIISSSLREVDIVSRFGGEEFAILLPHTSKDGAVKVAERILTKIRAATFKYDEATLKTTASIGVASMEDVKKGDSDEIIRLADLALYTAKQKGRDRVETFVEVGESGNTEEILPS